MNLANNSNESNRIGSCKNKIVKCKYSKIYKVQNKYLSLNSNLSNKFHQLK